MSDEDLNFFLDRLSDIEDELASQRRQLDSLVIAHNTGRLTSWFEVSASTLGERDKLADYEVLELSKEIAMKRTEIRIREDERDHIKFCLGVKRA